MYGDYGNHLYTPAVNPYLNHFQPQQKQEVVRVNGENGARAFPMGANGSALLLDESGLIIWLVTTDGAGYKTVAPYDISPHQTVPAPDISTLEARIKKLEDVLHEFTEDTATT